MALTDKLTAIGDAIRSKTGGTDLIPLVDMPAAIEGISGGGGEILTTPIDFMVENGEPFTQEILAAHTFNIRETFKKTVSNHVYPVQYLWMAFQTHNGYWTLITWSNLFCVDGGAKYTTKITLTGTDYGCLKVDGDGNVSAFFDENCTASATFGELMMSPGCYFAWYNDRPV